MKKKINTIIVVILSIVLCVGCKNKDLKSEKVIYKVNNDIKQKTYDLNDNKIQQWEYKNNGYFKFFENDSNEWEDECPKVKKNFDLKWRNDNNFKRECVIAVIDSGIDLNNVILKKHLWKNKLEKINNIDDDNNGYIDDIYGYNFIENSADIQSEKEIDHGTAISSILCFNELENGIFNENINIKIMSLKVTDENGVGKIADLIKAIKYADRMGANICCISLTTYKENIQLKKIIKKSKMLFVFAAGNYSADLECEKMYPCSYNFDNTITVANIRPDENISKSSNYGKNIVEIGAPGTDILVLTNGGKLTYISGTSFAVPFVAKVGALEYSKKRKSLSAKEIKNSILSNSIKSKKLYEKIKGGKILSLKN